MARLTHAIFVKRNLSSAILPAVSSEKRYTIGDDATNGGYQYRGGKWYIPFGNINQIYTRVNGVSYPEANGSVITNEYLLKE
jgi:hypothetical protein